MNWNKLTQNEGTIYRGTEIAEPENAGLENADQSCQVCKTQNAVLENVGLKMQDWKMQHREDVGSECNSYMVGTRVADTSSRT